MRDLTSERVDPAQPLGPMLALLLGGSALLAAISLAVTGATTRPDPNSWIVFAQQILNGHGLEAGVGPSWKPLPVLIALPFTVISGDVGLLAWSWLARFALLASSGLLFVLVRPAFGRAAGIVAALFPLTMSDWFLYAIVGEAESVMVMLVLGAALCFRSGRLRWATVLGVLACLCRPEAWPFLLIWLAWRVTSQRRDGLIELGGSLIAIGGTWFLLPGLLGAGALQAADRAQGGATHARLLLPDVDLGAVGLWIDQFPVWALPLVPIGIAAAWLRRERIILVLSLGAVAWIAEVAVLALLGFPGITRYVSPASAVLGAAIGAAAGLAFTAAQPKALKAACAALLSVALLLSLLPAARTDRRTVRTASELSGEFASASAALRSAGGFEPNRRCGPLAVGGAFTRAFAREFEAPLSGFRSVTATPTVAVTPEGIVPGLTPRVSNDGPAPTTVGRSGDGPGWLVLSYPGRANCR